MPGLPTLAKGRALRYNYQAGGDCVRNPEIWVFIFILGLLGLNWPFLEIFHTRVVAYLFVIWVLFIILIAVGARKNNPDA